LFVPFPRYRKLLFKFGTLCVFEPPSGGLRATYTVHIRLIGKLVVDFLLVLIKLFCKVLRLRRYERISIENRCFCSEGISLAQNFRYKGSSPTNHSPILVENYDKRSFILYKNLGTSFFLFVTMHAFDKRMDGLTGLRHTVCCITCSRTVKIVCFLAHAVEWQPSTPMQKVDQCSDGIYTAVLFRNILGHFVRSIRKHIIPCITLWSIG